jgi:hypothetical protein
LLADTSTQGCEAIGSPCCIHHQCVLNKQNLR